ncbi:alpha/beta fold hydrolase [Catellatospora sp. KI3]|uniref:thioesterase II family protein n=1 Tax=Catellatospora sp. KI3 TaxID=3041620 RepID=UPI00248230D5|nr:thioesterase domain-containing protein [Catellatospora sp. KI3]MDI1460732.1 alpha/beta fold hydrolase [Catellatospora sp. KI3]
MTRATADRWLRRYHRGGTPRLRLYCLHYAGGSPSMFRDWPALLPAHVAVEAFMLPGRDGRFREPALERMDALVGALVEALRQQPDTPYALFGYSFGAQVSFHLAHALREAGLPQPRTLFVAASAGPSELGHVPGVDETDEELVGYMRSLGGTSSAVLDNPELLDLVLPTLRADLRTVATLPYTPRPPLAVPIHAFSGEADPTSANPELMAAWQRETTGPFRQTVFPGGHFFIDDALPELAAAIGADLDEPAAAR